MSETEEKGEAGGERVDHKEEAKQFQEQVAALKMKKQKAKCAFTRQKNRLFDYLLDYSTDRDLLKETLDKLENEMDIAVDIMNGLMDCYIQAGKTKDMERTANETEKIQEEYENLAQRYRQFLSLSNPDNHNGNVKNTETVSVKNSEKTIELDLSKNIKRVSVPTFYGEKTKYSSWKAAFTACIDNSQATPEYKLLHLRDSLRGRALKAIESLGHSAAAYEAAKERLERKFGGERRQVNRFLEELSNFPTIKYENAKIIERFADLLDIALINMKDTDTDTKSNFMYLQVMKKMTESMVTRYQRWIYENEEEESMETLKEWVVKESEFYTIASEIKHGMDYDQKTERAEKSFYTEPQQKSCRFCSENHNIWQCESFKSLPEKSRWEKTKELNLCFRCLNVGHQGKHCKTHRKCGVNGCQKLHNRLLHTERQEPQQNQEFNVTAHCKTQSSFVALRTVPVTLKSGHKSLKVNALLDDGSTKSYINSDIAHELGLNGTVRNVSVNVLDGDIKTFETMPVTFRLESVDGNTAIKMDAFTTNKVTGNMKVIDWNAHANKFPHLRDIKFPRVDRSRPYVDILIGVDYPELHKSFTEIYGAPGEPYARLGPLGWTCIGQPYNSDQGVYMTYFQQENIGEVLRGFWEIESSGTGKTENKIVSPLDKQVMKETEKCLKFVDGRYEVAIPWKKHSELPDNREMALKRLKHTEKKLNQKPEVKKLYQSTIENYLEKQYIRKVETKTDNISKGGRWYLPHFPVVKPDRDTTKVRIVFDASAKCSDESLNDNIHEGPKLQNDLFHVLLRFRKYPVALVCDISEMYLQISLREEDRPFHRFLWNSDKDPPDEYEFNRIVFGVNASPYLAQLVSRKNAEKYQEKLPLAAETVLKSTYMDDSLDSVETDEMGVQLYRELSALWKVASMTARKWLSNSAVVLEKIPKEDLASEVDLDTGNLPTKKVLGVFWLADEDKLTFKGSDIIQLQNYTKRYVLKVVARLFDPIGLLSPFIVQGKLLLQKMWLDGYDWDESVSPEMKQNIDKWFSSISELKDIRVNRCLNFHENVKVSTIHAFTDASELAYASAIYVRHELKTGGVDVQFVCSKTRVAPLKAISIPRLELMAAVMGARLASTVIEALQLNMDQLQFWTDSSDVLWWIHRESRCFKPFIANRVGEIHEITQPNQWRHVPSNENPADLGSRGSSASMLLQSKLWWSGPDFLNLPKEEWPINIVTESDSTMSERKVKAHKDDGFKVFYAVGEDGDVLKPENYSNWVRLVRVAAWVLRFIYNLKHKLKSTKLVELQADELKTAENLIIQRTQKEKYSLEYKALVTKQVLPARSSLLKLNPKIDEFGVLRSDSRLVNAQLLSYDAKFPIILPRKSWVTKLIVKYYHEMNCHSGTNQTLSSLSSKFWIESAREEIREWEQECAYCRKHRNLPAKQIMAPLPNIRTNMPLRAFAHTAVDFAGPYITIQGRGKRREKRYLCLFTCLGCRAVHLEIAYGLDTNSFFNAFTRFTSRRGVPVLMNSDNGTNFVGADRELKELVGALDTNKIVQRTASKGVKWTFNPPGAPHFGGVHEALIKSAKRAIGKVLTNADITDEELLTAFVGAEGLLNSRPLTYQSANPSDDVVLTPNHFLHGQLGGNFAPESMEGSPYNPKKRWRYVQGLIQHIWRRWLREFMPTLSGRKKWFQSKRDFETGDVVIVLDPDSPRGQWPLGIIEETFPGHDGHVRVVSVRVGQNILRRPIAKLCFLEHSRLYEKDEPAKK